MADLKDVLQEVTPSDTDDGDLGSAIQAAVDMIDEQCRHLKYKRNIIVISNGTGYVDFNPEKINAMTERMKSRDMVLKVLFVERNNGSEGLESEWMDEDSKQLQENNRYQLTQLCDTLGEPSICASYEEAIYSLSIPRQKLVRPIKTFKGLLRLGNAEKFGVDRTLNISVEVYPCVRKALPPSSSACSQDEDGNLRAVKFVRDYFIDNPEEPDGKQEVDRENLSDGYKYGREIVTFNEEEKTMLRGTATEAGIEIIGFVSAKNVPRWCYLSHTDFVIAPYDHRQDAMALSAMIHSLYETESFGIARYVPKNDSDIQVVLLAPYFDVDFEALVISQLPFKEDYRSFRFPSLLNVVNKTGEPLAEGRQKRSRYPSDQMNRAMEAYITKMDLMHADNDEEYMPNDEVFNPVIHRIQQTIKECALSNDTENLTPLMPILKKYKRPKEDMLNDCDAEIDLMRELFEIRKVERKQIKRDAAVNNNNMVAEQTELDLEDLLSL